MRRAVAIGSFAAGFWIRRGLKTEGKAATLQSEEHILSFHKGPHYSLPPQSKAGKAVGVADLPSPRFPTGGAQDIRLQTHNADCDPKLLSR